MNDPKTGIGMRKVSMALDAIVPVRKERQGLGNRYQAILASVKELGLVEPLVVRPAKEAPGRFLLLDGHSRYFALKHLGYTRADCIVSSDGEEFTTSNKPKETQ